jgi:acyl-CoA thioesterase
MPLPFVAHVGAEIVESAAGASLLRIDLAPFHLNSQGIVHGGVLFTLADTGMGAALYSSLALGDQNTIQQE